MVRRLIERGLMFGGLVPIASPALVARYNRAMERLSGRRTALADFHVDISGFSPEIGDEIGDPLYLDPEGVNRQFILLTTEQKGAPLLGARFSTHRDILRAFIEANEPQLFALTARDAVLGELVNGALGADSPERLLDIRRITIEADTTQAHVADATALEARIARFRAEPEAWWDDVLIAEMIDLAKRTGDVTRQPIVLGEASFEQPDFWTSHFGGMYVLRSVPQPAVIARDAPAMGELPLPVIALGDRDAVARHLAANGLVEPIVRARGAEAGAILQVKLDLILADAAARAGDDPSRAATRADLRALARAHAASLPPEYHALARLQAWAVAGGPWPRIDSAHPAYFYTLRGAAGPLRDLVNRLLAEMAPLDARQLFICHKEAFYEAYRGWPEAKRAFVADLLGREYAADKAGVRRALFGEGLPAAAPIAEDSPLMLRPDARAAPRAVPIRGPWGPAAPSRAP